MSRPNELYYLRFKICFHFFFFFICIYIFSYSSKTTCSTRKCMQLSLSNGCHSLSSCLTCFCLFFNILIIFLFTSEIKSSFGFVLYHEQGGCPHCFVFCFFLLHSVKIRYICVCKYHTRRLCSIGSSV